MWLYRARLSVDKVPRLRLSCVRHDATLTCLKFVERDFVLMRIGSTSLRPSKSPLEDVLNHTPSPTRVRVIVYSSFFNDPITPPSKLISERSWISALATSNSCPSIHTVPEIRSSSRSAR